MAACDPQSAALGQFPPTLLPFRALDCLLNTIGKSIALHAQAIHCDAWWLKQIALPNFCWVHADLCGKFVQWRLKGEAHIDGAVSSHGAAGGLVGWHALAVAPALRH